MMAMCACTRYRKHTWGPNSYAANFSVRAFKGMSELRAMVHQRHTSLQRTHKGYGNFSIYEAHGARTHLVRM